LAEEPVGGGATMRYLAPVPGTFAQKMNVIHGDA
jgi:hypothetical protein